MTTSKLRFPAQIKYIIGCEAAERFSYYGMKAILVVFMIEGLHKRAPDAKAIYHFFIQCSYFLPLLGGFLADRYLGKYRTILYLSLFYCLGHAVLAIWDDGSGLYWGLGLIALGAGGVKPCVAAFVGDQFTAKNQSLMDKVFSFFYFSINFGAFFSQLLTPWLLYIHGPRIAFAVPGLLMGLSTLLFWMGRKSYVNVPPTGKSGSIGLISIFWKSAREKLPKLDREGAEAALAVFKVFIACMMFWALFEQNGSTWTIQAGQMNRHVWGLDFQAAQIQAIEPILILILIPLFTFVLYPWVERLGMPLTHLRKMTAGMLLTGVSFVWTGILQHYLDLGHDLSVLHQIGPYIVLASAEVLVSVTALEFAYTQAPRSMKSTLMSFWYLTIAFGNFFSAVVSKINFFTGASEFYFYATCMFLVSLVFIWNAGRYKERNYVETA